MAAVAADDGRRVDDCAASLRRLDEQLHDDDKADDYRRSSALRPSRGPVLVPPSLEADEDEDDVEVMFGKTAPDAADGGVGIGDRAPDEAPESRPRSAGESVEASPTEAPPSSIDEVRGQPGEVPGQPVGEPEPVEGPDPGPEFEPGFSPPR